MLDNFKQANDYTGFNMLLGKQYYDRQTKQKVWTNYKVCVFAKDKQAAFYQQALVVGTIVEAYAEDVKVDLYNPEYPNIELINAQLSGIFTQQNTQQNQQQPNQTQQNTPNQQQNTPLQQQNTLNNGQQGNMTQGQVNQQQPQQQNNQQNQQQQVQQNQSMDDIPFN